ncbi:MAG: hypothetical protein ACSW8C_00935 [bacterium]
MIRKICLVLLCLTLTSYVRAYAPTILSGKYQTDIIDWNFYYSSDGAGGGWLPTLVDLYGGCSNEKAILGYRRGIVPSATVDSLGDLYTISLVDFGANGPKFKLVQFHYDESTSTITTKDTTLEPWTKAPYGSWTLGVNPTYSRGACDESWFKWNFHNCLSPCLYQLAAGRDSCVRIFAYCPTDALLASKTKTFEGGLYIRVDKSNFNSKNYWSEKGGPLSWDRAVSRRYGRSEYDFSNCWGNYQGLVFEFPNDDSADIYLFFLNLPGDSQFDSCSVNYLKRWSWGWTDHGAGKPAWGDWTAKDSGCGICPRFIRAGSYVYCAAVKGGYWMQFGRMNSAGNSVSLGVHISDVYLETTLQGVSDSAYNFDFCLLNKDGTPCTKDSPDDTDENKRKILCVFSLGGGGGYMGMTSEFNWDSTYVSWTYNLACGIISSVLLPANGGSIDATYNAWAQNKIYITGFTRCDGNFVSLSNTSKSDLYRLYLNSHKMVPYTSPSGKHYLIFAYCYPGKKQHLYLGYAQYFIDSDYRVRLLTKTIFKAAGNDGWGDSFGSFTDCSRILAMDLKEGHLWITFIKD